MVIGVVGVGTAGLQSIAYMLGHFPDDVKIVSIYDPSIDILGIGESTTTFLPYVLSTAFDFSMLEHGEELDATTKHGVKYSNWGNTDFYSNILPPYHGMHFNNFKLKDVVLSNAHKLYSDRFSEIQGRIQDIKQDDNLVYVQIDNETYEFDYLMDCTGYPKDYSEYTVDEMPVNRCFVNMVETPGNWNYTHHRATKNGWMFGIPLTSRQGWGYLFNDTITTEQEAKEDIASIFNTNVEDLNLRDFKFKNYHANKFIDGRIAVNGNKALFYEPMEALSGTFYEAIVVEFAEVIFGNKTADDANKKLIYGSNVYKDFICMVYSSGSIYKSNFWTITKKKVDEYLNNSETFKDIVQRVNTMSAFNIGDERVVMFPVSVDLWKHLNRKLKLGWLHD